MKQQNLRVNTRTVKEGAKPEQQWLECVTIVLLELVSRETHSEEELLHRAELAQLKYIIAQRRFIDHGGDDGTTEE